MSRSYSPLCRQKVLPVLGAFVLVTFLGCTKKDKENAQTAPSAKSGPAAAMSTPVLPRYVKVELDVPRLSLASRTTVEKVVGKADRIKQNTGWQSAEYHWGELEYERGIVTGLSYSFPPPLPDNVDEALARVGLRKASPPGTALGGNNYQWSNLFGTALRCCGFEFESVMLARDFSSIDIAIKKRIPKSDETPFEQMTAAEHTTFAEKILRTPIEDVNRGNLDEAKKHLDAAVELKPAEQRTVEMLREKISRIEADRVQKGIWSPREEDVTSSESVRMAAWARCRSVIEENLKAPSTAEFQSGDRDYVHYDGKFMWTVQTKLDAQNSFGAKIRGTFTCKVRCANDETCEVVKLTEH